MARKQPLKTLENDIVQIPPNELKLVDVPATEEPVTAPVDIEVESGAVEAQPAPVAPPEEDQTTVLQKQLDQLKAAEENYKRQLVEAERHRAEAQRQANERELEVTKYRGESEQAQYDSILNAIGASQAEANEAKKDLKTAYAEANHELAAEAQERLSRAHARLTNLEDGKAAFEARREEVKAAPKTNGHTDPVEARINSMQGLSHQERLWLKDHGDVFEDPRKLAKLNVAYYDAMDARLDRSSPSYFAFLEERLGYRAPSPAAEATPAPQPRDSEPPRSVPVQAPVSRETASVATGKPATTRVTLTVQQRESARISGISELDYAKQLIELEKRKKEGHYSDGR